MASAWVAAVGLAVASLGAAGLTRPLLPPEEAAPLQAEKEVGIEDFIPVAETAPAPAESPPAPQNEPPAPEDLEIPPLPEILQPVQPPEMPELTHLLEMPVEVPKPKPVMPPKPAPSPPRTEPPRPRTPATPSRSTSTAGQSTSPSGSSGSATLFTGQGAGRFPSPAYPAAARASGAQGAVRLLVTVEASGIPSTVTVQTSSGSSVLDRAAQDHIRRRWRWPSGQVRRYIVPIRFVLQR